MPGTLKEGSTLTPLCRVLETRGPGGYAAICGLRISSVLSLDLFRHLTDLGKGSDPSGISAACQDRWTNLANVLAALPEPFEVLLVAASPPREPVVLGSGLGLALFVVGRGARRDGAEAQAARHLRSLRQIVATTLDFVEFAEIGDDATLGAFLSWLAAPNVLEIRRRMERFAVQGRTLERRVLGFTAAEPSRVETDGAEEENGVVHLFPWIPSDDPWRRLLETLDGEAGGAALVVHARGFTRAPDPCLVAGRKALANAERMGELKRAQVEAVEDVLRTEVEVLEREALDRLVCLEGRVLAARVFLATQEGPSNALVGTVLDSIDDASTVPDRGSSRAALRGGARTRTAGADEIVDPLEHPDVDILFSPREASAILRTPMPSNAEVPGLAIQRARNFRLTGISGTDAPLGVNVYRGSRIPVCLDTAGRFRHTYVIGQTGTGKSTLLLRMIHHDICRGRGVAVVDPHGALIEDLLSRIPAERADDVVLIDLTDTDYPVGFNILRIDEADPHRYRHCRDLLIDDLYGYLDRTYDMKQAGGPIFETHFRGMLSLLLGAQQPPPERVPNLMIFRSLYTNNGLQRLLAKESCADDPVLSEFVREAIATGGEASLQNLAPYITSKFSRFISDSALRNITCQKECLDFGRIVDEGKILLIHLGKGRFGELAAGLLAGQVISRIRDAVMRRGARPDAAPFFLYADEFQLVADEPFGELLAEARKFGLALTLAHQYADQIPEKVLKAILGNVGTVVSLRIGAKDGEMLGPLFQPIFDAGDLASQANYRACVRSSGTLGLVPFSVELAPPDAVTTDLAEKIRALSREKYARHRDAVEPEIIATYKTFSELREE
jgi:hypothetical protein